jgi:hypothetical protein
MMKSLYELQTTEELEKALNDCIRENDEETGMEISWLILQRKVGEK